MTMINWIKEHINGLYTREQFLEAMQQAWPDVRPDTCRRQLAKYEQRGGMRLSSNNRRATVEQLKTPSTPQSTKPCGKTLEQFRQQFDVREKIRSGLSRIGEVYMTDTEFREFCGVPLNRWRRYADLEEFLPFRLRLSEVLYWASADMILEMRNIAGVM